MAQLALPCPHCRAEKIGFAYRNAVPRQAGGSEVYLFMQCEGCNRAIVAVVRANMTTVNAWAGGNGSTLLVSEIYPRPEAIRAPNDVPPNVASAFISGMDNLGRTNGTNAAAIMFRRSIEVGAKSIDKNKPHPNLRARIDALSSDIVTPAMKAWAHHVRLDANEAAHDPEEFSEDDAKQLHVFAEMFLTYAFTLPKMLERAAGKPPA